MTSFPKASFRTPIGRMEMVMYEDRAKEKLDEWRDKLAEMKLTARRGNFDGVAAYREMQRSFIRTIRGAEEVYEELVGAGDQTWEDAKITMEFAWEALEDAWAFWTTSPFNNRYR
ncbi:hypothetical protein A3D88_04490 [Candidatus Peribacteria bacterium RIFCSPHIGHO2_02_FULL_52_16]|nr:MAG: hypothetical protein A2706_03120 [Candidatus Peribacteria bacterium RIFCSPHIGHO2_01_FULL_51_35]OGJ60864.1 MAG: hypothetical protein A3D88_04490 [Candidatus Peribacteria bacterium RIFCSPHIGHO2_02_FULL_52_16]